MSTLKWKKREEGYIKKTPAGSSMIKPASQMTSQQRSELLKLPRGLFVNLVTPVTWTSYSPYVRAL